MSPTLPLHEAACAADVTSRAEAAERHGDANDQSPHAQQAVCAAVVALHVEPAEAHGDSTGQSPHAQRTVDSREARPGTAPLPTSGREASPSGELGPSRTSSKSSFQSLLKKLEEHERALCVSRDELSTEVARLRGENADLRRRLVAHSEDSYRSSCPSETFMTMDAPVTPKSNGANLQVAPTSSMQKSLQGELPNPQASRAHPSAKSRRLPSTIALVLASALGLSEAEQAEEPQTRVPSNGDEMRVQPSSETGIALQAMRRPGWSMSNTRPQRCMISPVSRFRLSWDFVAFTCLLLDLWSTPFELVFLGGMDNPLELDIINWAITSFFVADIGLNFTTGYIDRDKLVMQRIPSIRKYLRCWFWIDLIATIPFDVLASLIIQAVQRNILSMARLTRLAKVLRVLKTLRFLKMLRAVRLMRNIGRAQSFIEMFEPLQYFLRLVQTLMALCFLAHVHGCLFALMQTHVTANSGDVSLVYYRYYQSFRWAYNAITFGQLNFQVKGNPGVWTLEMVIASERILMALILGGYGVVKALTVFQEDANVNLVKSAAVKCFRLHKVSVETQISVMYSLHETRAAQQMQRHFKSLMSDHLPDELRRTVSSELWAPHLKTLGLFSTMRSWHPDFISELALLVREEVIASKTVVCREGHASIAAYYIFKGRLMVMGSHYYGHLPDFTDGMWVEEMALVSPARRRSSTLVAPVLSRLMTVPTRSFHELIGSLGLEAKFQEFREMQLARGLCGRCGDVGDHFTHACPLAGSSGSGALRRPPRTGRAIRRYSSERPPSSSSEVGSPLSLNAFLHAHRLMKLAPLLHARKVNTRKDLEALDLDALHQELGHDRELENQLALLQALLQEQQEQALFQICDAQASAQHFAFLSHYKHEAGTEAALMRAELERVLMEETHSPAHAFNVPFFLDSEDLSDLEELQDHVRRSHNLVLILTQGVLLRPWVLVEIVTAIENDVRVLLVEVNKRSAHFSFPDEGFYARLLLGQVLDADGQALLRERGFELPRVERALREVFTRIALPYSPHRSETIRRAEVLAVYKQCNYKGMREPRAESMGLRGSTSSVSRI